MASQTDLDQGGTTRGWVEQYLGPSVGWQLVPQQASSVLTITTAGTFAVDPSTTLVAVNVAGLVTIILPNLIPTVPGVTQPGLYTYRPITIVDQGGNAATFNITIEGFNGAQLIMGLDSILIRENFGTFTLKPIANGWENITP